MLRALTEAERPAAMVSYDEKSRIQVIVPTAPDLVLRRIRFANTRRADRADQTLHQDLQRDADSHVGWPTLPMLGTIHR
jgi:hypothetical protein